MTHTQIFWMVGAALCALSIGIQVGAWLRSRELARSLSYGDSRYWPPGTKERYERNVEDFGARMGFGQSVIRKANEEIAARGECSGAVEYADGAPLKMFCQTPCPKCGSTYRSEKDERPEELPPEEPESPA